MPKVIGRGALLRIVAVIYSPAAAPPRSVLTLTQPPAWWLAGSPSPAPNHGFVPRSPRPAAQPCPEALCRGSPLVHLPPWHGLAAFFGISDSRILSCAYLWVAWGIRTRLRGAGGQPFTCGYAGPSGRTPAAGADFRRQRCTLLAIFEFEALPRVEVAGCGCRIAGHGRRNAALHCGFRRTGHMAAIISSRLSCCFVLRGRLGWRFHRVCRAVLRRWGVC